MQATLYFGGPIHTMDALNSRPEAVLTIGQTIAATGCLSDLSRDLPVGAERVDLDGRALLPAFIDPHGHFPDSGFISLFRVDLASPPRGDCADLTEALRRLTQRAANTPRGDWVMGVLFDNTAIAERRMPTRAELDAVSADHPVWVLHASGHNGVANSAALRRMGITTDTPDPLGGRFGRCGDTGELDGLIEGISAMQALGDTTFLIDRARFRQGFDTARDEYLSQGVTLAQNAWTSRDMLDHFASFPPGADPGIDLILLPTGEDELAAPGDVTHRFPANPHIAPGPRKLFTDGAFQLQTAWLTAPYAHPIHPDRPSGTAYVAPDLHRSQVERLHRAGHQVHCHCNGDAAADLFIDAVEMALKAHPRKDHRHTIIHGQVLRDDQLKRMARLGMTVSFFSAHVHFWGDLHHDVLLGPERAARISPAASARRAGVRFTIHNDASVTPTRPLHLAHCAVERRTASGRRLGQDQRISRLDAVRAQTIEAAWQVFREHERGSIEPAKLADFAILDRDPLDERTPLTSVQVVETIRRGKSVYGRQDSLS